MKSTLILFTSAAALTLIPILPRNIPYEKKSIKLLLPSSLSAVLALALDIQSNQ